MRVRSWLHIALVEGRSYSLSSSLQCGKDRGLISHTVGTAMFGQASPYSSTYHQCVIGRLNGRTIQITANPSSFEQAEAHLVETMFYNEWAPLGESSVSKPLGTFVPKWRTSKMTQSPI